MLKFFRCFFWATEVSRVFASIAIALLVTGCAVNRLPFAEQVPNLSYSPRQKIGVAIVDQRDYLEGHSKAFVQTWIGGFGIPRSHYVYPTLSRDEIDKDLALNFFLQRRLVYGLELTGWRVSSLLLSEWPTNEALIAVAKRDELDKVLLIGMKEWFFRWHHLTLERVDFNYDCTVKLFDKDANLVLEKQFVKDRVINLVEEFQDIWKAPPFVLMDFPLRINQKHFEYMLEDSEVRAAILNN